RARQAAANPNYQMDVRLPHALPAWIGMADVGRLRGVQLTVEVVAPRAESALREFLAAAPPERAVEVGRVKQILARMLAAAAYAERLWGGEQDPAVCVELAERLRDALAQGYLLGQLLAMPELLLR